MTGLGAGAAMLAALALPDSANAQDGKNKLLAAAEAPSHIEQVIDRFRACVAEAAGLTTPEMVPDADIRKVAFDTMVEQCERIQSADLRIVAANDRIEARTRSIIEGGVQGQGVDEPVRHVGRMHTTRSLAEGPRGFPSLHKHAAE